jgi:hypothetical protein
LGLALGTGLGVPLALLALGIVAFLFWRERRRAANPTASSSELDAAGARCTPQHYGHGHGHGQWPATGGQKGHFVPYSAMEAEAGGERPSAFRGNPLAGGGGGMPYGSQSDLGIESVSGRGTAALGDPPVRHEMKA